MSEEQKSEENSEFIRSPEEIQLRKERAEIYKRMRPLNEEARQRYSKKKQVDEFADLLGGGGDDEEGPKIKIKSTNEMLRANKQCFQKLTSLSRETKEQAIKAVNSVKLNKFLDDAINALMAAKFTQNDIPAFVEVISILHQYYREFLQSLGPRILKECSKQDANLQRRRNYIFLVADLLIARVFNNPAHFITILTDIINNDVNEKTFDNFRLLWDILKWCGGDIFGINRGENTIMDCVFDNDPPGTTSLKKDLMVYFKALLDAINEKSEQGKANFEEGYKIIIKYGSMKSKYLANGKQNREEYEELIHKAKCLAFITNKEVPDPWVETEEMSEITTIDGVIKVPTRLIPETNESPALKQVTNTDDFYDVLADMDVKLAQPLPYDVNHIKIEVENAKNSYRIDTLARHYHLIDNEEDRKTLINLFSNVNKNRVNQVKYYARFIADLNQIYPDIGTSVVNSLKDEYCKNVAFACIPDGEKVGLKLHIARYIAELARCRVGIEQFIDCVNFTMMRFRPKTAEMVCTLINIAGKFFDTYCDQTHTFIRNILEQMKKKKDAISTHQYAIIMVEQTIHAIEPPEDSSPVFYTNSYNEYQAFIIHFFHSQIDKDNFPIKARKLIGKLLQNQEETKVDMKFIFNLVIDLSYYSAAQLPILAKFIAEFQAYNPLFGINIADILCERIRRFIECPNINYKQRLIMDARLLAELAEPSLNIIQADQVMHFANFILSYDTSSPSYLLSRIDTKSTKINPNTKNRDFTRVYAVARIIETLIPVFEKGFCPYLLKHVLIHLQIYTMARVPVPADVAFRISDLFDALESRCQAVKDSLVRIETIEDAKNYRYLLSSNTSNDIMSDYTLPFLNIKTKSTKLQIDFSHRDSSDEEEDDNNDDLYEENFMREMQEFTETLDKIHPVNKSKQEKITISPELYSSTEVNAPKITSKGPIGPFAVYTTKNEYIEFDGK